MQKQITLHTNIAYGGVEHPKRALDLYVPSDSITTKSDLMLIWVHGGAWISSDRSDFASIAIKYASLGFTIGTKC
jgi:acetyl esterase/lipase